MIAEQAKLPVLINEDGLKQMFGVSWSKKTLLRRIQDGFPAIRDCSGQHLFEPKQVLEYFRRRTVK